MGVSCLRSHMAQSSTQVEKRAIDVAFSVLKQVNWGTPEQMGETTGPKECRTDGCRNKVSQTQAFCPACINRQQQPQQQPVPQEPAPAPVLPRIPTAGQQPLIRRSLEKKNQSFKATPRIP